MFVKIITPICGIEAGRTVSVSSERGSAWIARGFAVAATSDGKVVKQPDKQPKKDEKPGKGKEK